MFILRRARRARLVVLALVASLSLVGATPMLLHRHHSTAPGQTTSTLASSSAVAPQTQTIVAVGDSITKGDWDSRVAGGWVTRLQGKLRRTYPGVPFRVLNAGVDGDTTAGVLTRLTRDVLAAKPQLVVVSIGTNDFDFSVAPNTFNTELHTLIRELHAAPSAPALILASMLPIAGQSEQRFKQQRSYNDIIRQTAADTHVGYLDLFDPWLALGTTYLHALRHDTEHPNPIGYELVASITAAFLEAGYLDDQGHIMAPSVLPTCAPELCGS